MTDIKILGPGCPNCQRLEALVRETLDQLGMEAEIEKVTEYEQILGWGVMATPGLVMDGSVVLSGRLPTRTQLVDLLTGAG